MGMLHRLALKALAIGALCVYSMNIYTLYAQKQFARISVGFYNLENLFDTIDGENKDEEFLPNGANAWTEERYQKKLANMASAISQMIGGKAPDVLGVCEIENRQVLEDLIAHPLLAPYGYQIAHFESPDRRGIDVGLLYRAQIFKFTDAHSHPVTLASDPNMRTRDVLEVNGTILGEPVNFLVAHWPSRAGGEQASLQRRMAAALTMKHVVDSLRAISPKEKTILMGDFNDDPISPSLTEGLKSINDEAKIQPNSLFNVMAKLHRSGYGTLAYQDVWNLFDNVVVSDNLIGGESTNLQVLKDKKNDAYGHIFNAPFLTQKTGHYKGYPFRTFSNGAFQNGYSDHYPVFIYLVKELRK